jgi:hypothetical protein
MTAFEKINAICLPLVEACAPFSAGLSEYMRLVDAGDLDAAESVFAKMQATAKAFFAGAAHARRAA